MRTVSAHQPNYIPWLGYFYKIYISDYFVFLDDVQYSNEGMHNFNYIKTQNGRIRLKIPVFQTLGDKIMEVETKDYLGWKQKHLDVIKKSYGSAKHFYTVYNDIRDLINIDIQPISELNIRIIKFFCQKLEIKCEFIKSSDLDVTEKREDRIIKICNLLGADIYYSGTGAKAYQNDNNFRANGIELKYAEFMPFKYNQIWNDFIPNVSIIDYLMNYGYDWKTVISHQNIPAYKAWK